MRDFFASVGRFFKGLFKSSGEAPPTQKASDELTMERELRRGIRGD